MAFMCGLLYIRIAQQPSCPVEPLVAPVVYGARYQDKPFYFSDVIVRDTSPYCSFNDLRGCVWAYNERASHSGWNLVCYHLYERGTTPHFFAQMLESGSHLQSLHMILAGQANATAIDSHVLDVLRQQQPELATQLRVISSLGPTTIPPLVVAKKMDAGLKADIQAILLNMHHDPHAQAALHKGLIKRFAPVQDEDYDDIRHMFAVVQEQQAI
jgi:phosphonate transport system substrate-binding protein